MTLKITHIITGLDVGGAETMLYNQLTQSAPDMQTEVISLSDIGATGERIQALGVPVRALGMRPSLPNPLALIKLAGWLRASKPDVVQTWMYHADLIGGIAAKLAGGIPVAWNIQNTFLASEKRRTRMIAGASARLSGWLPAQIVACAEKAKSAHIDIGYRADKMVVIENAVDVTRFQPDHTAGQDIRASLNIPPDALIIGHVARFHPVKDHQTFVTGAKILLEHRPDVHFLMCGKDVTWDNPDLSAWIDEAGDHRAQFHLLGARSDVASIYSALDVFTLSSLSEAFPLTVGEAMACAVPCVVTDVGDSARLVGDTGKVVPQNNPQALADAWRDLLRLSPAERVAFGEHARQRVETHFSLTVIAGRYHQLYESLAGK